jgi:cytochrome b561
LHLAFYAAIIGQASLGFVASYLWFGVAPLHVAGSWVILSMVAIHVAAAAWHTLVLRDDTLDRMAPPLAPDVQATAPANERQTSR